MEGGEGTEIPINDEVVTAPLAQPESVITNPTPKMEPDSASLNQNMDASVLSGADMPPAKDQPLARLGDFLPPSFFSSFPSDERQGMCRSRSYIDGAEFRSLSAHGVSLLSGLYALLVILLAFAFEISVVVSPDISSSKYDPFYIYLYLVALFFIGYVQAFLLRYGEVKVPLLPEKIGNKFGHVSEKVQTITQRSAEKLTTLTMIKNKASHSAPEGAGSLFLRLGMIVFGVIGVIYYCLELFGCAAGAPCTGSNITALVLGTLFMFAQMYFIFQNSKLTIHRFKHLGRLGLMHLVATNLSVWIRLIVDEQFLEAEHASTRQQKSQFIRNFRMLPKACHTPAQGDVALLRMDCYLADFKPLLTTAVIEYSLICAAVSFILWKNIGFRPADGEVRGKRKEAFRVDCSATIKGLFAGLIFAILAIISMVIFFIKIRLDEELDALWIFYSTDCAFYTVAIVATFYGAILLRRLPYTGGGGVSGLLLLDDILLFVGLVGQLLFSIFSIVSLDSLHGLSAIIVVAALLRMIQVLLQTLFILAGQRLAALSPAAQKNKPGRQLVIFLLVANLAFFLINTFEAQKATLNPLMVSFYGRTAWAIIVHSAVPLTIFFRFHSAVCLAEIWKLAYRVKSAPSPSTL